MLPKSFGLRKILCAKNLPIFVFGFITNCPSIFKVLSFTARDFLDNFQLNETVELEDKLKVKIYDKLM